MILLSIFQLYYQYNIVINYTNQHLITRDKSYQEEEKNKQFVSIHLTRFFLQFHLTKCLFNKEKVIKSNNNGVVCKQLFLNELYGSC